MSKLVFHIGTHKTATTSIQNTFWDNATLLEDHGLIYPRLGSTKGHHGLAMDGDSPSSKYYLNGSKLEKLYEISERYADSEHTVFLSSEEFSRGTRLKELGRYREALSAFDQIEVICVLRPQWAFLQSIYLEVSKRRVSPRPPMMVDPVFESRMYEGLWIDYNGLLDELEKAFAPTEITFFDFQRCCAAEGGIIGSMLTHLGAQSALPHLTCARDNVSPMSLASWAANILSEPNVAPRWLVNQAAEVLKTEFGENIKPCLFSRREFRLMEEHYSNCNTKLQHRRAEIQPDFSISPPHEASLGPFRDDITDRFWLKISRRSVHWCISQDKSVKT